MSHAHQRRTQQPLVQPIATANLLGHLLVVAGEMAAKLRLERGLRLVVNSGPDAGESVPHVHVHLLAGRPMAWPPG